MAEHGSLLFTDADNFKRAAIDHEGLGDRIHEWEKHIGDVGADDTDITRVIHVILRDEAAACQLGAENHRDFRGVSLNLRIQVFTAELDARPRADGRSEGFAIGADFANGLHVVEIQVLSSLYFKPFVHRSNHRRPASNRHDVWSETQDSFGDVIVESRDDGHHGDYRHHANDDAEQRQQRSQKVCAKRREGDKNSFREVHSAA